MHLPDLAIPKSGTYPLRKLQKSLHFAANGLRKLQGLAGLSLSSTSPKLTSHSATAI
jgi:hypothetical protein